VLEFLPVLGVLVWRGVVEMRGGRWARMRAAG
jgi:hypothetical protein